MDFYTILDQVIDLLRQRQRDVPGTAAAVWLR